MNRFHIDNDLTVRWSFAHTDGTAFPISDYTYEFFYITSRGATKVTDTTVLYLDGNVLVWKFLASAQTYSGNYTLLLNVLTNGVSVATFTYKDAFALGETGMCYTSELNLASTCDYISVTEALSRMNTALDTVAETYDTATKEYAEAHDEYTKASAEYTAAQAFITKNQSVIDTASSEASTALKKAEAAETAATAAQTAATNSANSAKEAKNTADSINDTLKTIAESGESIPESISAQVTLNTEELATLSSEVSEDTIAIFGGKTKSDFTADDFSLYESKSRAWAFVETTHNVAVTINNIPSAYYWTINGFDSLEHAKATTAGSYYTPTHAWTQESTTYTIENWSPMACLRINFRKADNGTMAQSDIETILAAVTISVREYETSLYDLAEETNSISYMRAYGEDLPSIDTAAGTITIPVGNLLIGSTRYITTKQTLSLHPTTTSTSGWKLIFDTSTKLFSVIEVATALTYEQKVIGQFLLKIATSYAGFVDAQLPFEFTINGAIKNYEYSKIDLKHTELVDIVNSGIDTTKTHIGQIFRISPTSRVYLINKSNSSIYGLIALGHDDLIMNTSCWANQLYLDGWETASLSVDNRNYNATIVFVFFKKADNSAITSTEIENNFDLYITDMPKPNCGDTLTAKVGALAVAHRGIHVNDIPEDSVEAWRTAARCRMDVAEADVCITSDRKFVMMHDTNLSPDLVEYADGTALSSSIAISSLTFDDIRTNYRLKSNVPIYQQTIPSLEEYLLTCREYGIYGFPEIKSGSGAAAFSQAEAKEMYEMCCQILGKENFGIQSTAHALLDYIRSIDEDVDLCYMYLDVRGTTNSITGKSRFDKHTSTMLTSFTADIVKAYRAEGSIVYDGNLVTPNTLSSVVQTYCYPAVITNECGPNLNGMSGIHINTERGWDKLCTNGTISNGKLTLASGQYVCFTSPWVWLGGMILNVKYKGALTVIAQNTSKTESSTDAYAQFIERPLIHRYAGCFKLTATSETIIDRLDYQFAEL